MRTLGRNDYESVKQTLLGQRYTSTEVPCLDTSGVYALFLVGPAVALGVITVPQSGVLYVGMTASSLKVRNHFAHEDSGFSSPRRTLGAMLRSELKLRAIPRGAGSAASNVTNYRFPDDGEQRLTDWMCRHLVCGLAPVDHCILEVERRLIADLQPPLNLNKWRNPQGPILADLRKACRHEARSCPAIPVSP